MFTTYLRSCSLHWSRFSMYILMYVVYFIVPIEIPPVEDLMVTDQCTAITANWSVTEGPCTNLSYIVTLLSPDGGTVKGPFTTNDIDYNFTDVETLSGTFNVSVVSVDNERGASVAVIDVG